MFGDPVAILSRNAAPPATVHPVDSFRPVVEKAHPDLDPVPRERDIRDKHVRAFLQYWRRLHQNGRMPRRVDIDPVEVPQLLKYIVLMDVVDNGADFRFRLIGGHTVEMVGVNPTGRLLSDYVGDNNFGDFTLRLHRLMMDWQVPIYNGGSHRTAYGTTHSCERIMCPLSEDGRTISTIASCAVFTLHCRNADPVALAGSTVYLDFAHAVAP
jgi:hypothetical protein